MSNTEDSFSIENLESNLKKAPCLCSIIGYDNIIKKTNLNIKKARLNHENLDLKNLGRIAWTFGTSSDAYQRYLESLFRIINYYQIRYPKQTKKFNKDLLNPNQSDSTLSEIEVAAKLAPYFKITPDHPISQSKSNLDLLIEDKSTGEKALIEIATSIYDYESHMNPNGEGQIRFLGGKGSKGNKIKNALDKKLTKQLKNFVDDVANGKIPLEFPLVIIFNNVSPFEMGSIFNQGEIELGLYEKEFSLKDNEDNIFYRQVGFYHEENIEFISKIGVYKLEFDENYRTIGRFYEPIKIPQRKMSSEFERKLENVLFDSITQPFHKR